MVPSTGFFLLNVWNKMSRSFLWVCAFVLVGHLLSRCPPPLRSPLPASSGRCPPWQSAGRARWGGRPKTAPRPGPRAVPAPENPVGQAQGLVSSGIPLTHFYPCSSVLPRDPHPNQSLPVCRHHRPPTPQVPSCGIWRAQDSPTRILTSWSPHSSQSPHQLWGST